MYISFIPGNNLPRSFSQIILLTRILRHFISLERSIAGCDTKNHEGTLSFNELDVSRPRSLTLRVRCCTILLYPVKHAGTCIGVFAILAMAINSRKVGLA